VLGEETKPDPATAVDLKSLHAKIGELTLEKRFFSWCTREGGPTAEHKAMIDRSYVLSLSRQAIALGISRWSVYYQAEPVSESDMRLLRRIDQLHLDYPFAGS